MLLPAQFPFDVRARGTLKFAGQAFMLAAYAPWMRASIRSLISSAAG